MASARVMPGVCGVLPSSSPLRMMRRPWSFQSGFSVDWRLFILLPYLASFPFRPHHGGIGLAAPHFLKFRQVRERADHAILCDGMRIGLHHQALRLDADRIAAELSPGNKELLLRSEAVDIRRTRFPLKRLLIGKKSDFGTAQVSDALTQYQLAVMMNAGLDEIVIELIGHAGRARMELF